MKKHEQKQSMKQCSVKGVSGLLQKYNINKVQHEKSEPREKAQHVISAV